MMKMLLAVSLMVLPVSDYAQEYAITINKEAIAQHKASLVRRAQLHAGARKVGNVALVAALAYAGYYLSTSAYNWVKGPETHVDPSDLMKEVTQLRALVDKLSTNTSWISWCKTQLGPMGLSFAMNLSFNHLLGKYLTPIDAEHLFGRQICWKKASVMHNNDGVMQYQESYEVLTRSDAQTRVSELLDHMMSMVDARNKNTLIPFDPADPFDPKDYAEPLIMPLDQNTKNDLFKKNYYKQQIISDAQLIARDLELVLAFLEYQAEKMPQLYTQENLDVDFLALESNDFFERIFQAQQLDDEQAQKNALLDAIKSFKFTIEHMIQKALIIGNQK